MSLAPVDALWDLLLPVVAEAVEARAPVFAPFAGKAAHTDSERVVAPQQQPVVAEWLDHAVAEAGSPWSSIAEALRAASDALAWVVSYDHLPETPELAAFRDHYSWVPLVQPAELRHRAPRSCGDLLVGFTLQAPHVHYPSHHHEPPELYGVISGTVEWQVGTGPWQLLGPGDVIAHGSDEMHQMRTLDAPVLTWVMWPRGAGAAVHMPSLEAR